MRGRTEWLKVHVSCAQNKSDSDGVGGWIVGLTAAAEELDEDEPHLRSLERGKHRGDREWLLLLLHLAIGEVRSKQRGALVLTQVASSLRVTRQDEER